MNSNATSFKSRLQGGGVQIGLWQALANPYTAEICAGAGFDWLLFDGEHGPNDIPLLLAQLQAVSGYQPAPVARPPSGEAYLIKQYLDIGFQTLLVPLVNSGEQAAELVRAVRYPPSGIRGVGTALARASQWNRNQDYLARASDEICLIVQVETRTAISNLEAIARTDGVDAVFIGPADLSASLGYPGEPHNRDVQAVIADAIDTILRCGKAPGIIVPNASTAKRYAELGCRFIAVGSDLSLLLSAAERLAREVRQLLTQI